MHHPGPELERARNRSATVIQMFWRRHAAQLLVAGMKQQQEDDRRIALLHLRNHAAIEIQVWLYWLYKIYHI